MAAAQELATSPAARWVGTGVRPDGRAVIHKCMRCGVEDTLELPMPASALGDPSRVPVGFDEKVFAWARSFHKKHESCVEAKSETKK